jgi:hypothetical protein
MNLDHKYLAPYMERIVRDQLVDDLTKKGYNVTTEVALENFRVDILAKRENETIIYEIKTSKDSPSSDYLNQLREFVKQLPNHKLKIAIASPPIGSTIEIANFDVLVTDYFGRNPITSVEGNATHISYSSLDDVAFDGINVAEDGLITVFGNAVLGLTYSYGSEKDLEKGYGMISKDSLAFGFRFELEGSEKGLRIRESSGSFTIEE